MGLLQDLRALPIIAFYKYMYRNRRPLFYLTLFSNYLLPVTLELLPWWASRGKLARLLRNRRNDIQHALMGSSAANPKWVSLRSLLLFGGLSLLYAWLHAAEQILQNRVFLANRLLVRRMVLQRVLHSQIGSLQRTYRRVFGMEAHADDLETRVFADVSETLYMFNDAVPHAIRNAVSCAVSARALWRQRHLVDALALVRPTLMGVLGEVMEAVRERALVDRQAALVDRAHSANAQLMRTIVDGLQEIQVNSMQEAQLRLADRVGAAEMSSRQGWYTLLNRAYSIVVGRSVFDFITDVYISQRVMRRNRMDHQTFRRVQLDINQMVRRARRVSEQLRGVLRCWQHQRRVLQLLNLPRAGDSGAQHRAADRLAGGSKCIGSGVLFSDIARGQQQGEQQPQGPPQPPPPSDVSMAAIALGSELRFAYPDSDRTCLHLRTPIRLRRGGRYAIVGRNGCGKSTLLKLLCKLYEPVGAGHMHLELRGGTQLPFSLLPLRSLRSLVAFCTQRPYVFPGTVLENIRVGRPDATVEEVLAAARDAGLFLHAADDGIRRPCGGGRARPRTGRRRRRGSGQSGGVVLADEDAVDQPAWVVDELQNRRDFAVAIREEKMGVPAEISLAGHFDDDGGGGSCDVDDGVHYHRLADRRDYDYEGGEEQEEQEEQEELEGEQDPALRSGGDDDEDDDDDGGVGGGSGSPIKPWLRHRERVRRWFRWLFPRQRRLQAPPQPALPPSASDELSLLHAPVEVGGSNLSGGFVQSLALARVLLRGPQTQLLVLDEALSAMDAVKKHEHIVPHLLAHVARHNTALLLVSHDVLLVGPLVDEVIVMDAGSVVAVGPHHELLDSCETYRRLAASPAGAPSAKAAAPTGMSQK